MKTALIPFLAVLVGASFIACSSGDSASDDTTEDALGSRAKCALGAGACEAGTQLLAARSYSETSRAPAVRRQEVTVDVTAPDESTPRVFARATSRPFTWDGRGSWALAANAEGTAPLVVDDVLLVEVLDASSSEVLASGVVNSTAGVVVRLAGTPVEELASAPGGWDASVGGGSVQPVQVTALLPKATPFRIRLSGLDYKGASKITDVYLARSSGSPDASHQIDLFDDVATGAPSLSATQITALFPSGGASVALGNFVMGRRMRACTAAGCGDWEVTASLGLQGPYIMGPAGFGDTPASSQTRMQVVTGTTELKVVGGKNVIAISGKNLPVSAPACRLDGSLCTLESPRTECITRVDTTQYCETYLGNVIAFKSSQTNRVMFPVHITEDYVYARTAQDSSRPDASGKYFESQFVLFARVGGGASTLAVNGSHLVAGF